EAFRSAICLASGVARAVALITCRCYASKNKANMPRKSRRKKQVTPERLMQFGFAYAPPLIIGAAVNNQVFDTLESGAKTVDQVSNQTAASRRGLSAIMNALVGLELLKKDRSAAGRIRRGEQARYSLTPESAAFLVSNKPGSLAGFFAMNATHLIPDWLHLSEVVRTGAPAIALNQESRGPEFFSVLVENIIPMSYPAAMKLGESLRLSKAKTPVRVLDVAAGSGIWGIALAQQSPQVQVTAQDWTEMIPTTKRITQKFGVAGQFSYVAGDVLKADFGRDYDIATLGHILHTEGEERSRELLKRVFRALKPGGTIAVAEWLVDDKRTAPLNGLIFAVNMLVHSEHGDTFSFREIKSWLQETGFEKVRKLDAPGPSPLVLATKPPHA
ncbi:MAG TPA: class I SAM-dependent methyltransferase, partial [Chthoniobacterales bacterium]|nr:class I SAM-dependent methyltransferase [Chthoniobacterales bacterium]